MKQVRNEDAVIALTKALKALDDCNPDVGMPPGNDWYIREAMRQLGLNGLDVDLKYISSEMRRKI